MQSGTDQGIESQASRNKLIKLYQEVRIQQKEKARAGLLEFTKYTKKDYEAVWFHELICFYLDKLLSGEIKKLMIFIPPQHGKSHLSSIAFPAFALGKNPKTKVAVCSYSGDLASRFNRDTQTIIESEPYRELFPKTFLKSAGTEGVEGELRNTRFFETVGFKGSYKSAGIQSSLTGNPVDIGIIDDPFAGREQANSKAIRKKVWEWYLDTFLARCHNNTKQLMLFTRWHEDDLAGRLLDPENPCYDAEEASEWTVIALPALKEATKPLEQALDVNDPREIDEALWENKHSAKKFLKQKRNNPTGFTSLSQQRPSAQEGNKIKREWLNICKASELPFNIDEVSADFFIDGAYTEKTENDETGLMSCYYHKPTGRLYIFNCTGVRKEMHELVKYFKDYAINNGYTPSSKVNIELKASGHPLKSLLRKPENGGFNAIGIDNKIVRLGKLNRVEASEGTLVSDKVWLVQGSWNAAFIDQCAAFPNGKHDDLVDVLTYAVFKYFIKEKGGGVSYLQ